ncbi:MAG TPA: hypothetical protein VF221_06350 [Chloroflexota bacterium]
MVRTSLYLLAAAVIWLAEGFLFSRFLAFSTWQTVLLFVFYVALMCAALYALVALARSSGERPDGLAAWRALSLAPMVTFIVGSFVSLPLVLFVLVLGKL